MFCKYCGTELSENDKFCATCGAKVNEEKTVNTEATPEEQPAIVATPEKKSAKCWTVFGKVARILSIVAVSTCWIPNFFALQISVPAFVFAILSKQSDDEQTKKMFSASLTRAIIATAVSLTIGIVFACISEFSGFSYDAFDINQIIT